MSSKKPDDSNDGDGCFIFIAAICVGIGAGTVWGNGYGWLAAGGVMVLMYLSYCLRRG